MEIHHQDLIVAIRVLEVEALHQTQDEVLIVECHPNCDKKYLVVWSRSSRFVAEVIL